MEIQNLVASQREFFKTKTTYNVNYRLEALNRLLLNIKTMERDITDALRIDLGKSAEEAYLTEIGMTYEELRFMIGHVKKFSGDHRVATPLVHFHGRSFRRPVPYGNVLVMSPWNYPFLLALVPTIDALAAGNTVIIKPGSYSEATGIVIKKLIEATFDSAYVAVVLGGRDENKTLLDQKFDYIFFTGSTSVGRFVMEKAAAHLTPVTLELGGKSPAIVDMTADLAMAARRIVFGKLINCGQTCIAPDYLIVHKLIKPQFIDLLIGEIKRQYGADSLKVGRYGKIINKKHFERLSALIANEKLAYGGRTVPDQLKIEPTILEEATLDSPAMNEEIFGPILPVLTFENTEDIAAIIEKHPTPLALYLFTKDQVREKEILTYVPFGGGCVNDTIVHIATTKMPFGGVGNSGMGGYHGYEGFKTFSHYKSILKKSNRPDIAIRYQPYTPLKTRLIKWFLK
ncbi:MAG: aldehyde dehydrogenase [Bacilli bacterium]|jgi:aldehyde dehydrogenase (NAD+)